MPSGIYERTTLWRNIYITSLTASPSDFLRGHGNWGLTESEYATAKELAIQIENKIKGGN